MILLLLLGVLTLGSCLKDGETVEIAGAALSVNAVPGSQGYLLALDNNQLNQPAYGEYFRFGDIMPYRRVFAGKRMIRVFPIQEMHGEPLLTDEVTFEVEKYYTLVVAGPDEDHLDVFVLEDNFETPEDGKAMVRFIHLSPNAPSLDFGIEEEEDSLLASAKAFKEFTTFVEVDAGSSLSFFLSEAGENDTIYEFSMTPAEGRFYTIWAKGLLEDIEHGVIQH